MQRTFRLKHSNSVDIQLQEAIIYNLSLDTHGFNFGVICNRGMYTESYLN